MLWTHRPLLLAIALCFSTLCLAGNSVWLPLGPYGGDVRSLAAQPNNASRLFLGTSNGQVYSSADGGRSWTWWGEIGQRSDFVVDHLIVTPNNAAVMFASVWSTEANGGGGVYRSQDGGRTWTALSRVAGESIRSLAQWNRDPRVLVAGSISGVFRSVDGGKSWQRISPFNHEEIRNIESVSIDPRNSDVIYAGTWHLAWKTEDGGETWTSIRNGMIDDSDVFSIQPDWSNPGRVYASACSGIYRSENGGELWRKIQGIPHSARRTRVIRQDPTDANIVYAGTTEGLWRSESGGESWTRLTPPTLIVNDIFIDPGNPARILLATDRAGVLLSTDRGATFGPSNQGFTHRQVSRTVFDPATNHLYTAVLNDKEYGGVFTTGGHGAWRQVSQGLEGRDVFALVYAQMRGGGRLLAGTGQGVMAFNADTETWSRLGRLISSPAVALPGSDRTPYSQIVRRKAASSQANSADSRAGRFAPRRSRKAAAPVSPPKPAAHSGEFEHAVNDLFQAGPDEPLYAATNQGLYRSMDAGETWQRLSTTFNASTVVAQGKTIVGGVPGGLEVSMNGGSLWFHIYLPTSRLYAHVNAIAISGKIMLVATDAGLFRSTDSGGNWERKGNGVPYNVPVTGVRMMPGDANQVFAASPFSGRVYASRDAGNTFEAVEEVGFTGHKPRSLAIVNRNGAPALVVSSAFDGLFVRPLEASSVAASRTAPAGQ